MKRTERVTKRANLAGWALTALSLLCGGIQALAKENAQTGRRCQPAAAHLSLGLPQLRCIWKMSPWLSSPNQNFRSKNRTNRGAFLTTRRYFAGPVILVAANAMKCGAISSYRMAVILIPYAPLRPAPTSSATERGWELTFSTTPSKRNFQLALFMCFAARDVIAR